MLCFLDTTFLGGSEPETREVLAGVSRDANTSSCSSFSVKSSNLSGKSRNKSPCTGAVSLCSFLFLVSAGSRNWFPSGELLVLRRRVVAGLDEWSSVVSCGDDGGDVLAVEVEQPDDNPRTAIGTYFSVLHRFFCNF